MTRPRSTLVSVSDTPYYHCIGRCVRRAFLCGMDVVSGKSYEHRKPRILERLALLTDVFAIDLCAYALMSNHYHLVVRLAPERAAAWNEGRFEDFLPEHDADDLRANMIRTMRRIGRRAGSVIL